MPVRESTVRVKELILEEEKKRPEGEEPVKLVVKYADNRAILARQDLFSRIRYVPITNEGEAGTTATERSFPVGQLRIETFMLVIKSWNVEKKTGIVAPITEDNVLDLLTPEEFDEAYERIVEMNPQWGGAGDDEGKST